MPSGENVQQVTGAGVPRSGHQVATGWGQWGVCPLAPRFRPVPLPVPGRMDPIVGLLRGPCGVADGC